jgi:anti-sigma factor RsiW
MRDTEHDWLRLCAYADDELPADEVAALEARLATEPDLEHELERIRDLKRDLATLRPAETIVKSEPGLHRFRKHVRRSRRAVVAAVAVFAVVLAAALATVPVWRAGEDMQALDAMAIHQRLSEATYVVDERPVKRIVSGGSAFEFRAPDLTGSRLYLVDVMTSRAGETDVIGMHYRGMRGCRLTIVATYNAGMAGDPPSGGGLIRTWSHDGVDFAVIANGMDEGRFASIADYARSSIRDEIRRRRDLRTAMVESYRAARPCA